MDTRRRLVTFCCAALTHHSSTVDQNITVLMVILESRCKLVEGGRVSKVNRVCCHFRGTLVLAGLGNLYSEHMEPFYACQSKSKCSSRQTTEEQLHLPYPGYLWTLPLMQGWHPLQQKSLQLQPQCLCHPPSAVTYSFTSKQHLINIPQADPTGWSAHSWQCCCKSLLNYSLMHLMHIMKYIQAHIVYLTSTCICICS